MKVARSAAVVVMVLGLWFPIAAFADVCVWRDPERTMATLFPSALDYRTVTRKISPEHATRIEQLARLPLDPTEKAEFNWYEITGRVDGRVQTVGTVLAMAGTGEFGAIEVVLGLDAAGRITGVYIQRSRERNSELLRAEAFLGQFRGRTVSDPLELGRDVVPVADLPVGSRVVTEAVRKMLAFYQVLNEGGPP